jgi:hypothetical protein
MKKIQFIREKGSCPIGYVGDYPAHVADRLVEQKYAEFYTEPKPEEKAPEADKVKPGEAEGEKTPAKIQKPSTGK